MTRLSFTDISSFIEFDINIFKSEQSDGENINLGELRRRYSDKVGYGGNDSGVRSIYKIIKRESFPNEESIRRIITMRGYNIDDVFIENITRDQSRLISFIKDIPDILGTKFNNICTDAMICNSPIITDRYYDTYDIINDDVNDDIFNISLEGFTQYENGFLKEENEDRFDIENIINIINKGRGCFISIMRSGGHRAHGVCLELKTSSFNSIINGENREEDISLSDIRENGEEYSLFILSLFSENEFLFSTRIIHGIVSYLHKQRNDLPRKIGCMCTYEAGCCMAQAFGLEISCAKRSDKLDKTKSFEYRGNNFEYINYSIDFEKLSISKRIMNGF